MITEIDKNTALVLIDFQKGILQRETAHPMKDVLTKAAALVEAFRKAKLPIVIVNVIPKDSSFKTRKEGITAPMNAAMSAAFSTPGFADIVEDIKTQPDDIFITKGAWNAFYNTRLHEELQKRKVTGIILCGVATSIGVEGTARAANELGYNISFATDAVTDMKIEAHQNSLAHIYPRLGELGTTTELIEKLASRK
jgi:nicotinamidase-related amidase